MFQKLDTAPESGDSWEDPEGNRYLSRSDVLEIENLRLKKELGEAQAQVHQLSGGRVLREAIAQKMAQDQEAAHCNRDSEEAAKSSAALLGRLAKKYDVDFTKTGYDDESGRLTPLEK